jgi:hypothetical protein
MTDLNTENIKQKILENPELWFYALREYFEVCQNLTEEDIEFSITSRGSILVTYLQEDKERIEMSNFELNRAYDWIYKQEFVGISS